MIGLKKGRGKYALLSFAALALMAMAQGGRGALAEQGEVASLAPGEPLTRTMEGNQTHRYRMAMAAGQFLRVTVDQQGIDVAVSLLDPDGKPAIESDSPNGAWGIEPISAVADRAGEYLLEVRSPNRKISAARYVILLEAKRSPAASDLARVAAENDFRAAYKQTRERDAQLRRAAAEKFRQQLPAFRALGDRAMELMSLNQIGLIHHSMGELPEALKYYSEALTIARDLKDGATEGYLLNNLGGVYDIQAEPRKALEFYHLALPLFRAKGDSSQQGNTLNNIGVIHANLGEWQKALDAYNQALELIKQGSASAQDIARQEASTLDNIGMLYITLGEPQRAFDFHARSLELRRSVKDTRGEARTLHSIGDAQAAIENPNRALEYYAQALSLRRTLNDRVGEAATLYKMGIAYDALGQTAKSLEHHELALKLYQTLGDRRQEAVTWARIGQARISAGQPEKAIEACQQALTLARAVEDQKGQATALQTLARAERDAGDLSGARSHIEQAIGLIENMRADIRNQLFRTSFFSREQRSYEFYLDLVMRMHRRDPAESLVEAAFEIAEKARARGLLETLAEARVDLREGVDRALIDRERELTDLLNAKTERLVRLLSQRGQQKQADSLKSEIAGIENDRQQVLGRIRQGSPRYAALTQPQPLGIREIRKGLESDTLLLEYSLGEERSYLWAVTANSIAGYELPARNRIDEAARKVYELLTARTVARPDESLADRRRRLADAESRLDEESRKLSEMVLAPAASLLSGKRLVIVADGALQYIPFAMLPIPAADRPDATALPLIARHEVVTLPSASALVMQRRNLAGRQPAARGIAVFADPVFSAADPRFRNAGGKGRTDEAAASRSLEHGETIPVTLGLSMIPRLPFTRQEADRILAAAPGKSNFKAVDFQASREAAIGPQLGQYRYVHFATHGYLNTENPGASAIVLSMVDEAGRPRPGLLTANDVYNLNLPAELVTLSACQTGLGKEFRGEGLVGLTRGFMYAGAERVVVSLWNVNDQATSELMSRFYKNMLKGGQRPAEALRNAQVEMQRTSQWSAPYYWAGFVLQGEWR